MTRLTRRTVLHAGVIAGGASLIGSTALRAATGGRSLFSLGVSSGEPLPDGMVLWTRLAPTPLDPDGGMPPVATEVRWEISATERFAPIRSGVARAAPDWGHSVHVEVTGLAPELFHGTAIRRARSGRSIGSPTTSSKRQLPLSEDSAARNEGEIASGCDRKLPCRQASPSAS
ncbi:hypothetical protein EAH79_16790 [Sphingomonas koreensis]|nr:hypothetical protein EAH79_16790 [Sphingomonas koreensis]